jgi:hypothetical protein
MMEPRSRLVACPACARHVRVSEPSCPFCKAELPSALRAVTPSLPAERLSRAALYALRAGALSVTAVACGGAVATGGGSEDSGQSDAVSIPDVAGGGRPLPDANFAVPYGLAPLRDGGSIGVGATDASAADASQEDAAPRDAERRDIVLIAVPYGLPPMP